MPSIQKTKIVVEDPNPTLKRKRSGEVSKSMDKDNEAPKRSPLNHTRLDQNDTEKALFNPPDTTEKRSSIEKLDNINEKVKEDLRKQSLAQSVSYDDEKVNKAGVKEKSQMNRT